MCVCVLWGGGGREGGYVQNILVGEEVGYTVLRGAIFC